MTHSTTASMSDHSAAEPASPDDNAFDRNNRLFFTWTILAVLAATATAALLSFL